MPSPLPTAGGEAKRWPSHPSSAHRCSPVSLCFFIPFSFRAAFGSMGGVRMGRRRCRFLLRSANVLAIPSVGRRALVFLWATQWVNCHLCACLSFSLDSCAKIPAPVPKRSGECITCHLRNATRSIAISHSYCTSIHNVIFFFYHIHVKIF